jgi:hypothetical protein
MGEAMVKGIAYPVATYEVVDTYENLALERRHLTAAHAGIKLDLELNAMTGDQRRAAANLLDQAREMLGDAEDSQPSGISQSKSLPDA